MSLSRRLRRRRIRPNCGTPSPWQRDSHPRDRSWSRTAHELGPGTADIIEAGQHFTAGQYIDALHEKAAYTRIWAEFFEHYDLLLTPTMQLTAFPVGLETPEQIEGQPVDPFFDDWCTSCLPGKPHGHACDIGTGRSRRERSADRLAGDGAPMGRRADAASLRGVRAGQPVAGAPAGPLKTGRACLPRGRGSPPAFEPMERMRHHGAMADEKPRPPADDQPPTRSAADDRNQSADDRDLTAQDRDQISAAYDKASETRDARAEARDRRAEARDKRDGPPRPWRCLGPCRRLARPTRGGRRPPPRSRRPRGRIDRPGPVGARARRVVHRRADRRVPS